jgi:hypothetical protein
MPNRFIQNPQKICLIAMSLECTVGSHLRTVNRCLSCLSLKYSSVYDRVVLEAGSALTTSGWLGAVNLWRPAGMLQCFPIFSMALACQTNIFEVRAVKEITVGHEIGLIKSILLLFSLIICCFCIHIGTT